ncbi:hypothetical protein BT96DRAFT_978793 [Gymnopus androsaceus JB14]|uniref:Uncharacterized protein n=1 Tax=Gymnopus androsaceus JB14 TaxID=1447944 RepID=A0A6A4H7K8_9AGAR|nr:hypothetical protein BT96DRAFT_978793 [Gymnopus androsaceus JB14]
MQLNAGINQQLSAISSIEVHFFPPSYHLSHEVQQSSWFWTIDYSETPRTLLVDAANEIMVWMANYQSGPDFIRVRCRRNLYSGSNGANAVWSFLLADLPFTTDFEGDIMEFSMIRQFAISHYFPSWYRGYLGSATLITFAFFFGVLIKINGNQDS